MTTKKNPGKSFLSLCAASSFGLLIGSILMFCSGSGGRNSGGAFSVPNPAIQGPITPAADLAIFSTQPSLLDSSGYQQSEYFISGTASSYSNVQPLESNGRWQVQASESADYRTRIVVYRPVDPGAFNGTVVIEWLNVSSGFDNACEWVMAHTGLMRRGYAWVGVSAQYAGVEGSGISDPYDYSLKKVDSVRYGSLHHPGDSFSYDIFSQAAQAVRHPADIDPLGGLTAARMIAAGQSQSAHRLMTYVNALARMTGLFDGFFIHSRLFSSAPLSQAPQTPISMPDIVLVRDDLDVPAMMLQTESDLLMMGSYPSRQEDSDRFRLWEVAGASHIDAYSLILGPTDDGFDPNIAGLFSTSSPLPGFMDCACPINSGPQHFVVSAAFAALDRWIRTGEAPASAPRLEVDEGTTSFVLDGNGNVLGGVRTSYVDAPIAKLSGLGQSGTGFCFMLGITEMFGSAQIAGLYADHDAFFKAVKMSTDSAVSKGFLLPEDGALIEAWAWSFDIDGQKEITRFSISGSSGTIIGTDIALTVPGGTDVTSLLPAITHTGASVSPQSGQAQDFTNPVTYTVTAEDSSTRDYTVTVSTASTDAKKITGFTFLKADNPVFMTDMHGAILGTDILLIIPFGFEVTGLIPTITFTGASISPLNGEVQNFTNPVTYTVTAEDSSTKDYTAWVLRM